MLVFQHGIMYALLHNISGKVVSTIFIFYLPAVLSLVKRLTLKGNSIGHSMLGL